MPKSITTTENKTYEVADIIAIVMDRWGFNINFICNQEASQQKKIQCEQKIDDETVVLRGNNGRYFLEYYKGKTMYPRVYSINWLNPIVEESVVLTESDYQNLIIRIG